MTLQANLETLVTVFGGSGFLGRHVVRALARQGFRVRAAVRRPDLAGHLQPHGRVGQIHAVQANLRFPESVENAVRDAQVVINLVGILHQSGSQRFSSVHAEGAATVARAARAVGAQVIQVSALGADTDSLSIYARTKADGEAAVLTEVPGATIFRPSIIFGPEDTFFNRFAAMARMSPALPLIGGGHTRFQPVFVGDVAQAIVAAVEGRAEPGRVYELGGPDVRTFRELMEYTLSVIERRRLLLPLPFGLARFLGTILQWAPGAPLTVDQVEQLKADNVVSAAAVTERRTLEGLGIEPTTIEVVVPTYLWRFRRTGQFQSRPA